MPTRRGFREFLCFCIRERPMKQKWQAERVKDLLCALEIGKITRPEMICAGTAFLPCWREYLEPSSTKPPGPTWLAPASIKGIFAGGPLKYPPGKTGTFVLAGGYVARQHKYQLCGPPAQIVTKISRNVSSPHSPLFGLCPRGARVQLQNHQIQGGRFCSWISWRRWL